MDPNAMRDGSGTSNPMAASDPEHPEPERRWWVPTGTGYYTVGSEPPQDDRDWVEVIPASSIASLGEQLAREQRGREDDDSRWANLYSQTLARAEKAEAERDGAREALKGPCREAIDELRGRAQALESRLEAARALAEKWKPEDWANELLRLLPVEQRGE